MFKLTVLLVSLFVFDSSAEARNLLCRISGDASSSTLKVEYAEDTPTSLYLKSPNSETYRDLNLDLEVVFSDEDSESFSAKPKVPENIDWSTQPNCFIEIGTQWYFVFNFKQETYGVYLTPFFVLKDNKCVPPRYKPQPKPLECGFVN